MILLLKTVICKKLFLNMTVYNYQRNFVLVPYCAIALKFSELTIDDINWLPLKRSEAPGIMM